MPFHSQLRQSTTISCSSCHSVGVGRGHLLYMGRWVMDRVEKRDVPHTNALLRSRGMLYE